MAKPPFFHPLLDLRQRQIVRRSINEHGREPTGGGYGGGGGGGGNTYGSSGGGGSGGGGGSAIGAGLTSPSYTLAGNGGGQFSSGGDGQVTITLPTVTPGQPANAGARAGDRQAAISWTAPASDGGATITSYTATASPGGQTCTWTSGPLTCTVTTLDNGTTYTLTVTATNNAGTGPASHTSPEVMPGASAPPLPAPTPVAIPAPQVTVLGSLSAPVPTVDLRTTGWGKLEHGTTRFRLTVRNNSSGPAYNVVLSARLSEPVKRVSAAGCKVYERNVTCRAGTIGSGESAAFTIFVTAKTRGPLNELVSVSVPGSQVGRDGDNNSLLVLGQRPLPRRPHLSGGMERVGAWQANRRSTRPPIIVIEKAQTGTAKLKT